MRTILTRIIVITVVAALALVSPLGVSCYSRSKLANQAGLPRWARPLPARPAAPRAFSSLHRAWPSEPQHEVSRDAREH